MLTIRHGYVLQICALEREYAQFEGAVAVQPNQEPPSPPNEDFSWNQWNGAWAAVFGIGGVEGVWVRIRGCLYNN